MERSRERKTALHYIIEHDDTEMMKGLLANPRVDPTGVACLLHGMDYYGTAILDAMMKDFIIERRRQPDERMRDARREREAARGELVPSDAKTKKIDGEDAETDDHEKKVRCVKIYD